MKKGRRPIELEDHDRTLGKGLEIGIDRYDDDEIIDLEEIIEVDGGVLEDDEDFDLDVELIDLDADLDFDDLEPEMMSVSAGSGMNLSCRITPGARCFHTRGRA